ncbi:MAG: hypothetical protein ACLGG0_01200 [Bacteriovoracia bacterium]
MSLEKYKYGLILLALVIGVIFYQARDVDSLPEMTTSVKIRQKRDRKPDPVAKENPQESKYSASEEISDDVEAEKTVSNEEIKQQVAEEQKTLQGEFLKQIKLQMKLPDNMHFEKMDLDDFATGVYGVSSLEQKQFAIIAANKTATTNEVVGYLNELKDSIPMLGNRTLTINESDIKKIDAPSDSGLGTFTIIPAGQVGTSELYAAYVERKDKKGSYLFLMSAPAAVFHQNEGALDDLMNKTKTVP